MASYLGATEAATQTSTTGLTAATTGVETGVKAATDIAGLVAQVKYWEQMVSTAQTAYEKAVAEQNLAAARVVLAREQAADFQKKLVWYALGIGAGVLVLGGVVFFTR